MMMSLPPSSSTPPTQDEFPSPLSPNRLHLPPPLPPSRFLGERRYVREICVVFLFGSTMTTADSDDKDDILTCSLPPSSTAKLLFLDCCANNFLCSTAYSDFALLFLCRLYQGRKGEGGAGCVSFSRTI